jgi:hypothetical protein
VEYPFRTQRKNKGKKSERKLKGCTMFVFATTGPVFYVAPVSPFLLFLCVLKGYSTLREGIRVLKGYSTLREGIRVLCG